MFFSGVLVVGAKRTPFGTYGGKLANTHMTELQTIAAKAALASGNVNPEMVDSVVIGNVMSVSIHISISLIFFFMKVIDGLVVIPHHISHVFRKQ